MITWFKVSKIAEGKMSFSLERKINSETPQREQYAGFDWDSPEQEILNDMSMNQGSK